MTGNSAASPRVLSATRRIAIGLALTLTAGCTATDSTQPRGVERDSSDVASVEISFGRSIGNGLSILDTITMVAVARDYRGNVVEDVPISWTIDLDRPLPNGETIASVVRTGPRRALLTMEAENAVVIASAFAKGTSVPVAARLLVNAPRRWQAFVWSADKGFTTIKAPAGLDVYPNAINDRGEIVGTVQSSVYGRHAFIWSEARGFSYLDPPGFIGHSSANAVNAAGQVTGWSESGIGGRAFVWTREAGTQFVTAEPRASGSFTAGVSINSLGQVAIRSIDGDNLNALRWVPPGAPSMLPVGQNNPHSDVVAINDAGDVLGYDGYWNGWDASLERRTAILWTAKGQRVELFSCIGLCNTSVAALNNRGQIAGSIDGRAFRRSAAGAVETIALPAYNGAVGMNDRGDVVGQSSTGGVSWSWVWTESGEIIRVGVPLGAQLANANAVNNKMQVTGTFR